MEGRASDRRKERRTSMNSDGSTRRSIFGARGSQARMSRMSTQQGGSKAARHTGGQAEHSTGGPVQVQVLDDSGKDVTPKPLLSLKPTVLRAGQVQQTPGHSTPTSEGQVSDVIDRISSAGFSRSGYSQEGSTGSMSPEGTDEGTEVGTPSHADGHDKEEKEGKEKKEKKQDKAPEPAEVKEEVQVPLTEEELERNVYITLKETETFWLLNIPGRCVANDSPEAAAVEESNERYRALLKEKEGSEMFVDATVQTLNKLHKNKEVQTVLQGTTATASQATWWDIVDSFEDQDEEGGGAEEVAPAVVAAKDHGKAVDAAKAIQMAEEFQTATESKAGESTTAAAEGEAAEPPAPSPLDTDLSVFEGLPVALTVMERAVTQNIYHDRLLLYRDFRPRDPSFAPPPGVQAMQYLWEFSCDLTMDRNVSCMAWNKVKKDMLAVGYGQFEFSKQKDGMVAFWSLKNPDYPDWTFKAPCGVTSLDFSSTQPSLLAVGFYDGMVAIYDVRAPTDKPILESGHTSGGYTAGKHSDPVWKLQWVERGSERGENLISISTDGRVTQWSIKKGLEFTDLMKLKRVHRRTVPQSSTTAAAAKSEAFISRRSSGMCFDFSPRDPSIYVVGTEDGNIHKCSCSYSEQYLESYFGHSGPLYQIQWSPFAHNLFLSASADWTVKLWQEDSENALITFQSGNEEVADLSWSPTNSTVFGTVTCDGRMEVWDLSVSTLKPILVHTLEETKLSCLLFSEASPIVVCGGSKGSVSVFRLVGVDRGDDSPDQQLKRMEDAMSSNIMSTTEDAKQS